MSTMNKLCVVVNGYSTGRFYPRFFRDAGYKCIHVQSKPDIPDVIKGCFCSSAYDGAHVNENVDETTRWISTYGQPDFIIAGSESGVNLADELSAHFGTHFRNGLEKSQARRDKYLMAESIRYFGLRAIKQARCTSADSAISTIKDLALSFPIVVKPPESTSGDGFSLCRSAEDVHKAFETYLGKMNLFNIKNEALLVQEFIDGIEYVVDTVSHAGSHVITDIIKYKKRIGKGGHSIYEYCDFLPIDAPEVASVTGYALSVLDALEIKYGPAHMEIMLDKIGPVLIEAGARLAGCMLDPDFISNAYGHNQVELSVLSYISPAKFQERIGSLTKQLRKHTSLVLLSPPRDGTVTEIHFDRAKQYKAFQKVDSSLKVGQRVTEPRNLSESLAYFYLQADARRDVDSLKDDIVQHSENYITVVPF